MKFTRIVLDDWEGIYDESGKLITQGHSINYAEVMRKLGHEDEVHFIENDNLDELGNSLPDNLNEILDYIKRK